MSCPRTLCLSHWCKRFLFPAKSRSVVCFILKHTIALESVSIRRGRYRLQSFSAYGFPASPSQGIEKTALLLQAALEPLSKTSRRAALVWAHLWRSSVCPSPVLSSVDAAAPEWFRKPVVQAVLTIPVPVPFRASFRLACPCYKPCCDFYRTGVKCRARSAWATSSPCGVFRS